MENASGEINSQASGNNNVMGSNVNLNNGGSAEQADPAEVVEGFVTEEIEDVTNALPGWEYDEANPGEANPLPTEGERDGQVDPINSILKIIPTREPWAGHLSLIHI